MDPTYDWAFPGATCIVNAYSSPCPNSGADIVYLLRYLVKKYHWIDLSTPDSIASFEDGILTVSIHFTRFVEKDAFEGADDSDTNVFFEIHTSLNKDMSCI